jgi:hypothetical protein
MTTNKINKQVIIDMIDLARDKVGIYLARIDNLEAIYVDCKVSVKTNKKYWKVFDGEEYGLLTYSDIRKNNSFQCRYFDIFNVRDINRKLHVLLQYSNYYNVIEGDVVNMSFSEYSEFNGKYNELLQLVSEDSYNEYVKSVTKFFSKTFNLTSIVEMR